jgi:predicted O-linked N-acetylglucosamine transferase (SPINDLY family)
VTEGSGTAAADVTLSTDATVLLQQASVWLQDGKLERAEEALRRVLALDPTSADAINLLGVLHHERGDREMGIRLIRAAIALNPTTGRYHLNLGALLASSGDRPGSAASYRRAIAANPGLVAAWASVIFEMDLNPFALPAMRLQDRRAFNAQHCAALTAAAPAHANDPNPHRPLHVGYLSADFTNHSAAMAFGPVLDGHDRSKWKISIYWQNERKADEITNHFRPCVNGVWREVKDLDDDQLAAQIREDGVDILVDLSGYSTGSRPLTIARKPAPIIVTAWGHATGLGIDASDYLLADAITIPPEHEDRYHERILRAPCVLAYSPWNPVPEQSSPPAEQNEFITFGYLGRPSKCNPSVWGTWAQILSRTPHSRLILKHQDYKVPGYRQRALDAFSALRIAENRIDFRFNTSRFDHLATHAEVDICLDPFPQNSGITLLESCLMGSPTVTLLGDHINGRTAASILTTIGHPEWVAETPEAYVDLAVRLAGAGTTLASRMQLRQDLLDSVLCNPTAYTRAVEEQYRTAWVAWCESQRPEAVPTPIHAAEGAA